VAFTLIELLVVISIIGVLAGLTLGLTGLATRKSKESRIRIEMTKLINDIETYKSNLGFYPPDNRPLNLPNAPSLPAPNQLYYELSGTVFRNNQFYVVGGQEPLSPAAIQTLFGSSGFMNAARIDKDLKFTAEFKASQVKRIPYRNQTIDVLAVPTRGPAAVELTAGSVKVNPWLYVSTSATNNPERYDLWTEVIIGGKHMRFSNWEKDPVVLSP
jgi:prepilin-type N-terminal cleavage/methylation domain-containing protein